MKSALNIGVVWPNGAYNIEKVGLITVAKSCSFFCSKKMLSEYSSPTDRLNRPAKPALASLTTAKLQRGKNARAAMKIHDLAIGSGVNDLLREDLSQISKLRENGCFIKYATIRHS